MPDVALLIPSCAGGGAEKVAFDLAELLHARGLVVDLVVAVDKGVLAHRTLDGPRKVVLGAVTELLALPQYLAYLRRERPGVVVAMVHTAQLTAGLGSIFHPEIPFISSFHLAVTDLGRNQWWFRRWFGFGPERWLNARARLVHAVSQGLATEVQHAFALPSAMIRLVGNPLAAGAFEAADSAPAADGPLILGIGRLVPQKDFATLIRAFSLLDSHDNPRLVILGEGPERNRLHALAAALGVADRVAMPGFVTNTASWLRRASVFALSSRCEGFSLAVLEALAAGTPVVATDCRHGPAELLAGGRFGRLVPVGDAHALAAALAESLARAPHAAAMARDQAALSAHLAQFAPAAIAAKFHAMIASVLPRRTQPATIPVPQRHDAPEHVPAYARVRTGSR